MKKLLAYPVTPADVTAALNRIAAVADQDDVNMVRAELARLNRVLAAGEDDDVFTPSWHESSGSTGKIFHIPARARLGWMTDD